MLALAGGLAAPAAAAAPPRPDARAWILVDPRDGSAIATHAARRRLPIASTTKLMTTYLALERLPLRKVVRAPAYEAMPGESLMGLRPGERVSVRSLLYGLLIRSGADAAIALADAVSGSVPAFVALMNRAAGRLGLRDTHYANPVGLDAPANYSSARDLARLAAILLRDPRFRRIVATRRADVPGAHPERVVTHNDLELRVPWVDGVKTGFTYGARYVLVASGTRHGLTLISVVLGAPTEAARDSGSLALLRYGFSLYASRVAVRAGERLGALRARGRRRVPLEAARTVRVEARSGQRLAVAWRRRHVRPPRAALAPGARLGWVPVTLGGHPVARVGLVAGGGFGPGRSPGGDRVPAPALVALAAAAIVILIAGVAAGRRLATWRQRGSSP